MTDSTLPKITVGVINYNGARIIERTLSSILESDYPAMEVIMVDDRSTDNSVAFVKEKFPQVRVFVQPENKGPNAARNAALKNADTDIVFVSDNDVSLAPDCLRLLVEAMISSDNTGVATPIILDAENHNQIYSNGAGLHYVCFGMVEMRHKLIPEDMDWSPRPSICGAGGIMLARKAAAEEVDGFDEDFRFGYTDGDFTFRISAAGWTVMQVPKAKIYHIEKPGRNPNILRYQVRNRLDLILKTYAARSIILLAPALLFFELSMLVFLLMKGAGRQWMAGVGDAIRDLGHILEKRRKTQAIKKRPDKELLAAGEIYMFPARLGGGAMKAVKKTVETLLSTYWALVRPLLTK